MKKLTQVFAVSAVAMTTVGMAGNAYAEDVDSKDSTASVEYKAPENGALTLEKVFNLDFGTHEISAQDQTYYASGLQNERAIVHDLRGTAAGWSVSILQNDDFKNGDDDLRGAQIHLKASPDSAGGFGSDYNAITYDVTLSTGNSVKIWEALEGTGNGISYYYDGKSGGASLQVPGDVAKMAGTYTTTLTWTLSDGVAQ